MTRRSYQLLPSISLFTIKLSHNFSKLLYRVAGPEFYIFYIYFFIFVDIWFLFSFAIIRYTFTFCQLESRMHAYLSLSYSYAKTAASRDALKYDHHHPRSGLTPTCGGTRPSTTTWRTSGCRPPGSGNLTYSCTTGRRRIFCR